MMTLEAVREKRDAILKIADKHGAGNVRIFGSVARGDAKRSSDLDLVVRFETKRSLMDHARLISELEDLLGVSVDVIDADGMQPRFRGVVERESLPI